MLRKTFILFFLLLTAGPLPAQSSNVKTTVLANGMKILVMEDHSIPNVAMYIFYRVGSRNERPGTTGISHFFEHMMFNGAKKYGPKEFDVVMEANGGANNAYTSQDLTVYTDWFPRSAMELIFDMEADRIRDLTFDPKMVESERGVVASERRTSVDAEPFRQLSELLWTTAYMAHTYQWPVIGWMVDIESWKMEDLKQHFRMGYSPSNATMVVVGDVTAEEIFALAKKYMEPIESHDPPPPVTTKEPEQNGERRAALNRPAQLPALMIGYHVPATSHPDYYPLEVFRTILFSGESSRMYQRIVDKDQLGLFIDGSLRFALDPTLFVISAQPKDGIEPDQLEKAIYEEIEKIRNQPPTDQELQKAKNILLADFYREMKTLNGKANALGFFEIYFGDHKKLFTAAAEYEKVSAADVQRVARTYFQDMNRTVTTLIPVPEKEE